MAETETTITVGKNSYIDTEEANEYFAGRLHAERWGETSDADKEKALQQATKEIDRQLLKGRKATDTQELAFPRYPDTEIPAWEDMTYNELKAAVKEAGIKGYGKMSKAELIEALKAGE